MGNVCICLAGETTTSKIQRSNSLSSGLAPFAPHIRHLRSLEFTRFSEDSILELEVPNAILQEKQMTASEKSCIFRALRSHFLFKDIPTVSLELLVQVMRFFSVHKGKALFEEGAHGVNFYILTKGRLRITSQSEGEKLIHPGQTIGELALIQETIQHTYLVAQEHCELWYISRTAYQRVITYINEQNYNANLVAIKRIPIFKKLTRRQVNKLVDSLVVKQYVPGKNIVREGNPGQSMYIVSEGNVRIHQNGRTVREMSRGEFFGELALQFDGIRTATVTALDDVTCLQLKRKVLERVLGGQLSAVILNNTIVSAIQTDFVLQKLTKKQVTKLAQSTTTVSYNEGDVVIYQGEEIGDKLYIVVSGSLKEQISGVYYDFGRCIGVQGLLQGSNSIPYKYQNDIVAYVETKLAVIPRSVVYQKLRNPLNVVLQNNCHVQSLSRIPIFHDMRQSQLRKLIPIMQEQSFYDQYIFEQGTYGEELYILKEGIVQICLNNEIIRQVTINDYFGERALILNETRSATAVAIGAVTCWTISKQGFLSTISKATRKRLLKRISVQDIDIPFTNLQFIKHIGRGLTGQVTLVSDIQSNHLFALKSINKTLIASLNIYDNIQQERRILGSLDNPFIIKFYQSYRDERRVHLLLEYVNGTDLFDVLAQLQILTDEQAMFFTALTLLILEHLNEREIVYRDIKPENFLVDEQGYIKLIDFGTAKIVKDRTHTLLGTPQYMAPEVFAGKGYSYEADLWSLGVIIFEFLQGKLPFGTDFDDVYKVYQEILNGKVRFNEGIPISPEAKTLILQLLNSNPSLRAERGIGGLKKHAWFQQVDWEKLYNKKYKAPYVPSVSTLRGDLQHSTKNLISEIDREESLVMESILIRKKSLQQIPEGWDLEF